MIPVISLPVFASQLVLKLLSVVPKYTTLFITDDILKTFTHPDNDKIKLFVIQRLLL